MLMGGRELGMARIIMMVRRTVMGQLGRYNGVGLVVLSDILGSGYRSV